MIKHTCIEGKGNGPASYRISANVNLAKSSYIFFDEISTIKNVIQSTTRLLHVFSRLVPATGCIFWTTIHGN
jgi:hypothetical protein